MKTRSIVAGFGVCAALLLSPSAFGGQGGTGGKGKGGPKCETVTADAEFRDAMGDGISSDNGGTYKGLVDANVYLLNRADHDFVLDTRGSGRAVTLDFDANNAPPFPFDPDQEIEVLIRSDEVLSVGDTLPSPYDTRLILWFDADDGESYKMKFDGLNGTGRVRVTNDGDFPCPTGSLMCTEWTIESKDSHVAQLERTSGPKRKRGVIGLFVMPVSITGTERLDKPPTCAF